MTEKYLVQEVKEELIRQGKTITAAESLTGGAFLDMISSEPNSSQIVEGGIVTYSERIKQEILGVSENTIDRFGVVSSQCAREMAENVRIMFQADIGVSLTGVAGPDALESHAPGTVWIGIAQADKASITKKFQFKGNRVENRNAAVEAALNLVRLTLLDEKI